MALNLVPQSTDTLASTQQPILQNFTTINAAFLVDHVEYALANQGKHNQVTFPIHVGPVPANGAPVSTEIYLFNQNTAPTNEPDIWLQAGAGTPYPITGSDRSATGWTFLPSGILLKWGSITGTFPNGVWVPFLYPTSANIPAFTTGEVFNVTLQASSSVAPPDTTQTFNYLTVAPTPSVDFSLGFSWIPRTNFGSQNEMKLFYFAIGSGV